MVNLVVRLNLEPTKLKYSRYRDCIDMGLESHKKRHSAMPSRDIVMPNNDDVTLAETISYSQQIYSVMCNRDTIMPINDTQSHYDVGAWTSYVKSFINSLCYFEFQRDLGYLLCNLFCFVKI